MHQMGEQEDRMQATEATSTDEEDVSTDAHDESDTRNEVSATAMNGETASSLPESRFVTGAVCMADLAQKPLPSVDYLVERLAIATGGRSTLVYGQSGRGKTLAISYVATCIATNQPLFGKYDVKAGEVLHVDYELGAVEMQVRYRQMIVGLGLDLDAAPGIWFRSFPGMGLDEPDARDHLARASEGKQLVIIDPLCRATSSGDNDPRVADALAMCGELSSQLGVAYAFVHHEGKRVGTGYGRGSSAIQDAAGCVLRVSSPQRGRFCIEQVKAIPHPVAPLMFTLDEVGGVAPETRRARGLKFVEYDPDAAPAEPTHEKPDVRHTIITILEEHPDGLPGRDLRRNTKGNTQRYVQSLRVLVAQGIVVARPDPSDGRRTIYQLARHRDDFEPSEGRVIQFPARAQSDEGDDD